MSKFSQLKQLQLDALKEVANIGGGHAATALSHLIGEKILVRVPKLRILKQGAMNHLTGMPDEEVVGILMHMLGDLTGHILLIFPLSASLNLVDLLLKQELGTTKEFDELGQSALAETANILGGSYLNAWCDFMGLVILPSIPSLVQDFVGSIFNSIDLHYVEGQENILCMETDFYFEKNNHPLRGYFLMIPDMESLSIIFHNINLNS